VASLRYFLCYVGTFVHMHFKSSAHVASNVVMKPATVVTLSESITNKIFSLTRQYTVATRRLSSEVYGCTYGKSAPHRSIPLQSYMGATTLLLVLPETVLVVLRWLYTV
jgi:hypothetical protein